MKARFLIIWKMLVGVSAWSVVKASENLAGSSLAIFYEIVRYNSSYKFVAAKVAS